MKNILQILFIINVVSCKAQPKNTVAMAQYSFDVERFEEKSINQEYNFISDQKDSVRQIKIQDGYVEYRKLYESYFELYRQFYSNGKLQKEVLRYPNDFLKGIMKEYDEKGNLVKETDYDKPYKFTFEDVLKILEEKEIPIPSRKTSIARDIENGEPFWYVAWDSGTYEGDLAVINNIRIHGVTGQIEKLSNSYFEE